MHKWIFVFFLVLDTHQLFGFACPDTISSQIAYSMLSQSGKLESVIIDEEFDLSQITVRKDSVTRKRTLRFEKVQFNKNVIHTLQKMPFNLVFQNCSFTRIDARNVKWLGSVSFSNCRFNNLTLLKNNFVSDLKFHNTDFEKKVSLDECTFSGQTEFLNCHFKGIRSSFSNTVFEKPTLFNDSGFENLKINFAVFQDDVSFIKCTVNNKASFQGVRFNSDAEFRYCDMAEADFQLSGRRAEE